MTVEVFFINWITPRSFECGGISFAEGWLKIWDADQAQLIAAVPREAIRFIRIVQP